MKFTIRARDGRVVGLYLSEPVRVEITEPQLQAQLKAMRQAGGVPLGPEGPYGWSPNAVVEYLRHDGYELVEEGTDGEQHADSHVSPDSGRVQVRRVATAQRPGASSRVASVRPGI